MAFRSIDRRGTPHPTSLSYPTFFDFRAGTRVFDRLVCYRGSRFTLTDSMPAMQVSGAIVSWDFFPTLGVQPALGRGFVKEEEKPGVHVAVLADSLWRSRFASDPQIVGKSCPHQRQSVHGRRSRATGISVPHRRARRAAVDADLAGRVGLRVRAADRAARRARARRHRPPEAWCDARAGAGADEPDRGRSGEALSGRQQERRDDAGAAGAGTAGGQQQGAAVDTARRGRPGAVHRLRKRRQPAAGACDGSRATSSRCGRRWAPRAGRCCGSF